MAGVAAMLAVGALSGCAATLPNLAFPAAVPTPVLVMPWTGSGCPDGLVDDLMSWSMFDPDTALTEVDPAEVDYPGPAADIAQGCFLSVGNTGAVGQGSQYLGVLPATYGLRSRFDVALTEHGFASGATDAPDAIYTSDTQWWTLIDGWLLESPAGDDPFSRAFHGDIVIVTHGGLQTGSFPTSRSGIPSASALG